MKQSILILVYFLGFINCNAQWEFCNGPEHLQESECMVTDGINYYLGTSGNGIFKSTDNCSTWVEINNGLTNKFVSCISINGNSIIAGTGGGVFLSTNNGDAWLLASTGITNNDIRCLATNGSNIYAGTYGGGIFLSTNNCSNWFSANTGITNNYIQSIVAKDNNVFAGTYNGLFKSNNNGSTWSLSNTGDTRDLIVNDSEIYASTGNKVLWSNDYGTSWTQVGGNLPYNVVSMCIIDTNFFVGTQFGVYLLENTTNWIFKGLNNIYAKKLIANLNTLYVINPNTGDLFQSDDLGSNWSIRSSWLTYDRVANQLFCFDSIVYIATYKGVYKTLNNGNYWSRTGITGLTFLYTLPPAIYVNDTSIFISSDFDTICISNNKGVNWVKSNVGLENNIVSTFEMNSSYLYAGTYSGGMFRSNNNGALWDSINVGIINHNITSITKKGQDLFVGTSNGIYYSSNFGDSWYSVNTGIKNRYITSLKTLGTNIIAGTDSGVFLTSNNGSTWMLVGLGNKPISALLTYQDCIFAATRYNNGEIFFTSDLGSSWISGGQLLYETRSISTNGTYIYATTDTVGTSRRLLTDFGIVSKIDNLKKVSKMNIYPNPTNNYLIVSNDSKNFKINVYDLFGKLIISQRVENKLIIDARTWQTGIYLLEGIVNEERTYERFIISDNND